MVRSILKALSLEEALKKWSVASNFMLAAFQSSHQRLSYFNKISLSIIQMYILVGALTGQLKLNKHNDSVD